MATNPLNTHLHGPGFVSPNGALSTALITFLQALRKQALAEPENTDLTDLQTQMDAISAKVLGMYGSNGVTVWVADDGIHVQGNEDQQVLASQIFGR